MRALLDVNVLIALIDPDHVSHAVATHWWLQQREAGWAVARSRKMGVCASSANRDIPTRSPLAWWWSWSPIFALTPAMNSGPTT